MSALRSVRFFESINVSDCPRPGKMDMINRKRNIFAFVCVVMMGGGNGKSMPTSVAAFLSASLCSIALFPHLSISPGKKGLRVSQEC